MVHVLSSRYQNRTGNRIEIAHDYLDLLYFRERAFDFVSGWERLQVGGGWPIDVIRLISENRLLEHSGDKFLFLNEGGLEAIHRWMQENATLAPEEKVREITNQFKVLELRDFPETLKDHKGEVMADDRWVSTTVSNKLHGWYRHFDRDTALHTPKSWFETPTEVKKAVIASLKEKNAVSGCSITHCYALMSIQTSDDEEVVEAIEVFDSLETKAYWITIKDGKTWPSPSPSRLYEFTILDKYLRLRR